MASPLTTQDPALLTPPSSSPLYPSSPEVSPSRHASDNPLSDLPSVRRLHTTDGYRAGLSAGKEDPHVAQAGFDQGYPVGVQLGMRVGFLLGALGELERLGVELDQSWVVETEEKSLVVRAEQDLAIPVLLQEMGARLGRGIAEELGDEHDPDIPVGERDWTELNEGWINELESVKKWSTVVEQAGKTVGLTLRYDAILALDGRDISSKD